MTTHQIIENEILSLIDASREKITPANLEKTLAQKLALKKSYIRDAIKSLVQQEALSYTYELGHTFIEKSFNKPLRISNNVVLKPPERHYPAQSNDIVVNIAGGAAFGTGRHPTTRLAVRGIEAAFEDFRLSNKEEMASCVDLGTGSGVLVIAAVLMGVNRGVGIDMDPNAIAEAKENVRLNGLTEKIDIHSKSVEEISGTFPLILANLRYTALIHFFPAIAGMCIKNGYLVMSGIKPDEMSEVLSVYAEQKFRRLFLEKENGWAGIVLRAGASI